jgi:hypothetical protein
LVEDRLGVRDGRDRRDSHDHTLGRIILWMKQGVEGQEGDLLGVAVVIHVALVQEYVLVAHLLLYLLQGFIGPRRDRRRRCRRKSAVVGRNVGARSGRVSRWIGRAVGAAHRCKLSAAHRGLRVGLRLDTHRGSRRALGV